MAMLLIRRRDGNLSQHGNCTSAVVYLWRYRLKVASLQKKTSYVVWVGVLVNQELTHLEDEISENEDAY
ncbi:hypothetical protein H5410_016770 [Solanum commersonii]|uniref:Uncharacterized protein n=1 Tax=Solanum commersonii TaxID=4109 RepID=A0A9J5ZY87_SOLCO|nr:hypothetical protein H5410_016770 [Solanum commersonii]